MVGVGEGGGEGKATFGLPTAQKCPESLFAPYGRTRIRYIGRVPFGLWRRTLKANLALPAHLRARRKQP